MRLLMPQFLGLSSLRAALALPSYPLESHSVAASSQISNGLNADTFDIVIRYTIKNNFLTDLKLHLQHLIVLEES